MVLTAAYNGMNSRTQLKATIASTLDFQNDYTYDNLSRMTRVTQQGQSGGNAVADKRVDLRAERGSGSIPFGPRFASRN